MIDQTRLLAIGIAGIALLLLAFVLEHRKGLQRKGLYFNILNFAGSELLALYAFEKSDIVFLVLNAVWAMIAAYFLLKILWGKLGKRHWDPDDVMDDESLERLPGA